VTESTQEKNRPRLSLVPGAAPDGSVTVPMISVMIPVYNEEGILVSSVVSLREHLKELGYSFEIVLCENGSSDRTFELCQELASKYQEVDCFSIQRANYGRALKEGILRARGTIVVCDEIDLGDIDFYRRALDRLLNGDAAMVVGSKILAGAQDTRPFVRHLATITFNTLLRILLHFHGTDTHGMKAFRRDLLVGTAGRCVVDRDVFASEFVIRAERERHPVVEIPVRVVEKRKPSINLFSRVPGVLKNLTYLVYVMRVLE